MIEVSFGVVFHTWFRVGAAYPRDGVDVAVDHRDPLPAEHLKGLMRAEARWLAGLGYGGAELVDAVFGTPGSPSPWRWSATEPDRSWTYTTRQRTKIDGDTHTALKDHTVSGELSWAPRASFRLAQVCAVDDVHTQLTLLRVAGASVHGVGAWRRRGLGAASIIPDPQVSAADLQLLHRRGAGERKVLE